MRVLAGDVGGTNARLAIVEIGDGTARLVREHDYRSAAYDGLAAIAREFLAGGDDAPDRGCIAIAGPVVDGTVQATNLPWTIEAARVGEALGIPRLGLINDFFAVGMGLDLLGPGDRVTLQRGEPRQHGAVAYLGAGTGLGVGFRLWDGERYRVYASEGGHVDFAPRNPLQDGLLRFLRGKYGRASNERVLSGRGLGDLYAYLREAAAAEPQPSVEREMVEQDPAAVVTAHALAGDDALCVQALDLFVAVMGGVTGNLALIAVATGGVYIAGGIAPRIVEKLQTATFLEALHDQGRLSPLVAKAPVHVVTNTKVGLLGAAACAQRR
ncbi:MAG: glucokinase [Gemmatimonadota bacterium]|nr:glucokinase [Gemmatimonadota bacterium]MDE3172606.1 glucokinase [Gemmatimonadota bacterium]